MQALAVVLQAPERLEVRALPLTEPGAQDVVVDVSHSGISTGTERLLWSGRMPPFPGLAYPLVPGYESVGTVVRAPPGAAVAEGDTVFVPGARCFGAVQGLFGGAANRLVTPATRVSRVPAALGEQAVLLALAATAWHALAVAAPRQPALVVGHGVLGRLVARLLLAQGAPAPLVWETRPERQHGATGYSVVAPDQDARRDYDCILDVSGDAGLLDTLVARLAKRGEVVLAGFYAAPLSFQFPPAFMREACVRIAAEWSPGDLDAVLRLVAEGRLDLSGLITHREPAGRADMAYRTAFGDPGCLKMILDWRTAP